MIPSPVDPGHVAWWFRAPVSEPRAALLTASDHTPDVGAAQAVVSNDADQPGRQLVHIPWRPDPGEIAHLACGGTLWTTTIGVPPATAVSVQPLEGTTYATGATVLGWQRIQGAAGSPERTLVTVELPAGAELPPTVVQGAAVLLLPYPHTDPETPTTEDP